MNISKKHRKIRHIKRDAFIFGIYEIRRRNKMYLFGDMKLYDTIYKQGKDWIRRDNNDQ